MYARVTQGVAREGKAEELIHLIDQSLAPEITSQPGCRGMILLTHGGTGQGILISLWESREALEEIDDGYLEAQLSAALPLMKEAPSVRNFRVSGMFQLKSS